MAGHRWRKTDESDLLIHCPDHEKKNLYYARTYTVGQGFTHSETNDLIINFKMKPTVSESRLRHKYRAGKQFCDELADLLTLDPELTFYLVPMPPSKTQEHSEYDDRVHRVVRRTAKLVSNATECCLLCRVRDLEPAHERTEGRSADAEYETLGIDKAVQFSIAQGTKGVVLAVVDDVLTSGSQFEAARRRLTEAFPHVPIAGIFSAK